MVTKTYPELIAESIEAMPATGPLDRDDVKVWHDYVYYLANLLEPHGMVWRGESVKNLGWAVMLVVKVARDGVPLVAFVTERGTTDCMRVFLRQLSQGHVNWVPDKFA